MIQASTVPTGFRLVAALGTLVVALWGPVAQARDPGVATVGSRAITAQELDSRTKEKLDALRSQYEQQALQLKLNFERSTHAFREESLNALLDERVLQLAAADRGTTPAALAASVAARPVSDADARQFYEKHQKQIGQPYEAVAGEITSMLQKQENDAAERVFLDSLRAKYKVATTLEPYREAVESIGPRRGPADAPVTIVEFSDFQCPYCGRFAPVISAVLAKYPNQVKLVFRQFPLVTLHPDAQRAAEASVCAESQGKFWEMHDAMFADQAALDEKSLQEKAQRLGLDLPSFSSCLKSDKARAAVQSDTDAAGTLGLSGTPTTFINGRYLNGAVPATALSAVIDDELRRAGRADRR